MNPEIGSVRHIDLQTGDLRAGVVRHWQQVGSLPTAYDAQNMADKKIAEKASRLSTKGNIRARSANLTDECQERTNTTVDNQDAMLKEAYQVAKESATPSVMVSASMALMKLHGYDAETRHKRNASNNNESTADALRELALRLPD